MAWTFVQIEDRTYNAVTRTGFARVTVTDGTETETIQFKFRDTSVRPAIAQVNPLVTETLRQRNRPERDRYSEQSPQIPRRLMDILIRRADLRGVSFDGIEELRILRLPD